VCNLKLAFFIVDIAKGFRMLAGNPMLRNKTGESRGICHRCLYKDQTPFGGAPCTGEDTTNLPTRKCEGGIRTQGQPDFYETMFTRQLT
jgi:hypothetical protein